MATAIGYLDGRRLRRSLLAAAAWVVAGRDELNRINVYPVPDGDTGTNFSHTVRSIADALHRLGDAPLPEVTRTAAEASVRGARGNSGMMLSHFLLGFSEGIGQRVRVRAHELAAAMRSGFERLARSAGEAGRGHHPLGRARGGEGRRAGGQRAHRHPAGDPAAPSRRPTRRCSAPPTSCPCSSRRAWWTPAARASCGCSRA